MGKCIICNIKENYDCIDYKCLSCCDNIECIQHYCNYCKLHLTNDKKKKAQLIKTPQLISHPEFEISKIF